MIAQANAARDSARATPARYTLRIGVLAGISAILSRTYLTGIAREVRLNFPETRLVCRDVPFPALTRCLPEYRVDVLRTTAPVRHLDVDFFPWP
ncbi:hypothetical protein OG339_10395 [Streptosporangium sp. NBC_01495]|uniref:hypothetical protein n=1 Tax=Streptosporangium sp. NBC_01495 TaxID=2903899 RepID=UPI002E31477B|nr:hypothetical protein [Streptosporangium sp. NBC_01495]